MDRGVMPSGDSPRSDGALGRRSLIGWLLASVAAVGLTPWRRSRPALRWARLRGFPDGPNALHLEVPGADGPQRLEVVLRITTPRETFLQEAGVLTIQGGQGSVQVPLTYPYDVRVPGAYGFHAEIRVDGHLIRTSRPATFSLRTLRYLA